MKQELLHHKLAYLILAGGLSLLILGFLAVWPDRILQRVLIGVLTIFYFGWGSITHLHTAALTKRVIYEYAAMSLLAGTLLMLITF